MIEKTRSRNFAKGPFLFVKRNGPNEKRNDHFAKRNGPNGKRNDLIEKRRAKNMKLSTNFLKEYVNIDENLDVKTLA